MPILRSIRKVEEFDGRPSERWEAMADEKKSDDEDGPLVFGGFIPPEWDIHDYVYPAYGHPSNPSLSYAKYRNRYRNLLSAEPLVRIAPYCLGYVRSKSPTGQVTWEGRPAVPYRIRGLFIWGATEETMITRFSVGNSEVLKASADPVPAILFSAGITFEEFEKAVNNGARGIVLGSVLRAIPQHFEFHRVIEKTVTPGDRICIDVIGPLAQLVTWGVVLL